MDQTLKYLESLQRLECPDASYNPLRLKEPAPQIILKTGSGTQIEDTSGNVYLDCISGFGSLILGHNHDSYQNALRSHIETNSLTQGLGDVYASESKVKLIEKLIEITPAHLEKVALAVTGSQAVELALKTAYIKTKKSGVISFSGAYHGLDMGVLSLEGRGSFRKPFAHAVDDANVIRLPFGCEPQVVRRAAQKLNQSASGLAAIITEPLQGRGGIVHAPEGWTHELSKLASEFEALFILDEIWTGMGRTGDWLFDSAKADLVCIGKALGGGMPISAVLGTSGAFDGWPENSSEALHTGTFFGHTLSCSVALETLKAIEVAKEAAKENQDAIDFVETLRSELTLDAGFSVVGKGYLCGVRHSRLTPKKVMYDLVKAGVLALPSGPEGATLSLTPALCITHKQTLDLANTIQSLLA